MLDPWMSHSQYDETVCWRCETGCGEHSCWRQEVSGRIDKVPEPSGSMKRMQRP